MSNDGFVTAFAPASIGNVGVGFDMLGLAIAGVGDRVSARRVSAEGVTIAEVQDMDGKRHPFLSAVPEENTASLAAASLWRAAGEPGGLELIVRKGIPLQSGMGSSAASAVAAAVAANALLSVPLAPESLLEHALVGEQIASGGLHADNVAPSLLGGLVLCPPVLLPDVIRLPVPERVSSVLVHPELQVNTADARRALADSYSREQWLTQQGLLAGFVAANASGDIDMLGRCLRDELIEPQRAASVPCFEAVKVAALGADALGCSLSGSGPSIFALCRDSVASNVATSMEQACREMGVDCQSWISPLHAPGASVD
jgi:homoserine kinase